MARLAAAVCRRAALLGRARGTRALRPQGNPHQPAALLRASSLLHTLGTAHPGRPPSADRHKIPALAGASWTENALSRGHHCSAEPMRRPLSLPSSCRPFSSRRVRGFRSEESWPAVLWTPDAPCIAALHNMGSRCCFSSLLLPRLLQRGRASETRAPHFGLASGGHFLFDWREFCRGLHSGALCTGAAGASYRSAADTCAIILLCAL